MGGALSKSVISFILGIFSILYMMAPMLIINLGLSTGIVLGTMGLYFSKISMNELELPTSLVHWFSLAGKVSSIFGIGLNLLLIIAVLLFSFYGFT